MAVIKLPDDEIQISVGIDADRIFISVELKAGEVPIYEVTMPLWRARLVSKYLGESCEELEQELRAATLGLKGGEGE